VRVLHEEAAQGCGRRSRAQERPSRGFTVGFCVAAVGLKLSPFEAFLSLNMEIGRRWWWLSIHPRLSAHVIGHCASVAMFYRDIPA
jgi:hypothetical protein